MRGLVEHQLHRAGLHHFAQMHDQHAITDQSDHFEVGRDEEMAHLVLFPQIGEKIEYHRLHGHIERGGGFVQYQQARRRSDGTGDADACFLPTGQLMREARPQLAWQPNLPGKLGDALCNSGPIAHPKQQTQRFSDRIERRIAQVQAVGR